MKRRHLFIVIAVPMIVGLVLLALLPRAVVVQPVATQLRPIPNSTLVQIMPDGRLLHAHLRDAAAATHAHLAQAKEATRPHLEQVEAESNAHRERIQRQSLAEAYDDVIEQYTAAPRGLQGDEAGGNWLAQLGDSTTPREPHTSLETAATFVASRAADALARVGDGKPIQVIDQGVDDSVTSAVVARLEGVAHSQVQRGDAAPGSSVARVALSWKLRMQRSATWWPQNMRKGTLTASITGPKGSAIVSAEFDEKPWLHEEMPAGAEPATRKVVTSPGPAGSAAEAQRMAREVAVASLLPMLRAEIASMSGGTAVPEHVVRRHAEFAIANRRGLLDRCVVRMDRPYGPVWGAAALYDFGPANLQTISHYAIQNVRVTKQSWARVILSLAGMMLVLAVVYGLLNAVTRGYFRLHLRMAVVMAFVVVAAVIFLLLA